MDTIPLLPDFLDLLRLLDEERVEYLVVGGMAVNYYGYHRSTGDLDIWVALSPENQDRLAAALLRFGFSPQTLAHRPLLENSIFLQLHFEAKDGKVSGTYDAPLLMQQGQSLKQVGIESSTATFEVPNQPGTRLFTGGTCPPTAQYALRQGKRLADNIVATIAGREPQPFRFKALGLLAGLGRRSAVAEIFGLRFSGFIAWWLWRTIYLMKLPGFERKLRVAIDWTLDLFFARDIVYLRPLHAVRGQGAVSHELPENVGDACEIGGGGWHVPEPPAKGVACTMVEPPRPSPTRHPASHNLGAGCPALGVPRNVSKPPHPNQSSAILEGAV